MQSNQFCVKKWDFRDCFKKDFNVTGYRLIISNHLIFLGPSVAQNGTPKKRNR